MLGVLWDSEWCMLATVRNIGGFLMVVIIALIVVSVLYVPLGVVFELTKLYGGGRRRGRRR